MSNRKIELEKQEEQKARKREEIIQNYKDYCLSHNKKPMSRRDLLGAGVYSFAASLTLPALGTLLMSPQARAQAVECPSAVAGASLVPFVTLNLAGGAGLQANYVPTDAGGQLLPTYSKMGLGDNQLNIENEFGNVPFAGDDGNGALLSKLLSGIRSTATAATLANTAFVAIPVRSRDDSGMNMFDASGMIAKAGLLGVELPNLGKRQNETGINQMYAGDKPPTPLAVGSYNDIASALSLGATGPMAAWQDEQKVSLVKLVQKLSDAQVNRINSNAGGRTLASLVKCASSKNVELSETTQPTVDIRQDGTLSAIWGVAADTGASNENVVFGSMVNAGLKGNAGTISLERGGYDYHDGTRSTGNERDGLAGAVIGRVLETAAALNKKVFLYVCSDGAVVSEESTARDTPWRSDRGSAGIAYMLAYDPAGRPQTSGHQIGQFNAAQAADDKFITGNNPALAASAVAANYLKFNGRMDLVEKVLGSTFSTGDLNKVIKF